MILLENIFLHKNSLYFLTENVLEVITFYYVRQKQSDLINIAKFIYASPHYSSDWFSFNIIHVV
jgi:hypothetical protein